jgi:nicotinamide-nucleotide amidase
MAQTVNAEIISIGTEILLGEITDTNSVHIARTLRDIGINIYFMVSVGDNQGRITQAIQAALSRADVVITTGGLGPTVDDMTRQSVAAASERGLTFHPDLLEKIAERFAGFGVQMTENNRQQAYLPDDAIVVENPVGTAPSFIVDYNGKLIISLPGVPREMRFLLAEKIVPFLRQRYSLGVIRTHVLRTAGIGESALDDLIGKELLEGSNPTVGLGAHSGVIDVRITAKADSDEQGDAMIAEVEGRLRARIGAYVFGTDKDTIQQALVSTLRAQDATVAISETGTGGATAQLLRTVEQGDAVVRFADTHAALIDLHAAYPALAGRTLREQAIYLAEHICLEAGAQVGLVVISNPDQIEDHADSDASTAVAVYAGGQTRSRVYGFGAQAEVTRTWTGTWSLATAWRMLQDAP